MNKYEEMAKKALAEQRERKAAAEAEARDRKARFDAEEAEKQNYLDAEVLPILEEAAKGLRSAGIEAQFGKPAAYCDKAVVLKVGHNKAGRTIHRQTTLTARRVGESLEVEVTNSVHGSQGRWKVPSDSPASALDRAIEKCVDVWTERNPLRP